MLELLVIRHGETDYNRQQRFQGQIDVPLNATGEQQARRLAERLAAEPIDVLLASDLKRAQSTAAPLAARRGLGVQLAPGWREQSFGVLEGLDFPTIQQQHGSLWDQWSRHDADYALPGGGESNRSFHARVVQAMRDVQAAHRGQRVAIVSHGGVLDMLWRTAHGLPLSGARECDIPNTGLNWLRLADDGRLTIASWADAAHLEPT